MSGDRKDRQAKVAGEGETPDIAMGETPKTDLPARTYDGCELSQAPGTPTEAANSDGEDSTTTSRRGLFKLGIGAGAAAIAGKAPDIQSAANAASTTHVQFIADGVKMMDEHSIKMFGRPLSPVSLKSIAMEGKVNVRARVGEETGFDVTAMNVAIQFLGSMSDRLQRLEEKGGYNPEGYAKTSYLGDILAPIIVMESIANYHPEFLNALQHAATVYSEEDKAFEGHDQWSNGRLGNLETQLARNIPTQVFQGAGAMLALIKQARASYELNLARSMRNIAQSDKAKFHILKKGLDSYADPKYTRHMFAPEATLIAAFSIIKIMPDIEITESEAEVGYFDCQSLNSGRVRIDPFPYSAYSKLLDRQGEKFDAQRKQWVKQFNTIARLRTALYLAKNPIDPSKTIEGENSDLDQGWIDRYPEFFQGDHLSQAQRDTIADELQGMADKVQSGIEKAAAELQKAAEQAEAQVAGAVDAAQMTVERGIGTVEAAAGAAEETANQSIDAITEAVRTASQIATAIDVLSYCASNLEPIDKAEGVTPNADAADIKGMYQLTLPENSLLQNMTLAMLKVADGPGCEVLSPKGSTTATIVITNEILYKAIEAARTHGTENPGDFVDPTGASWAARSSPASAQFGAAAMM